MGSPIRFAARFAVVALLACQQYAALALIYAAVPVVLRGTGAPLSLIGLFGVAFFAFTVNFLWAPLVDRWPLTRLGRRRSWLLVTQAGAAAGVAALALLDPGQDHGAIFAVCAGLATLAATQRIATLGYVADIVDEDERPVAAAVVGWGGALGNLVGGAGGLALIGWLGWRDALGLFALLMLAGAGAVAALSEPALPEPADVPPPGFPLLRTLRRPALWRAAGLATPATFGVAAAFTMIQPRLVDLGFGLAGIGAVAAGAHLLAFSVAGPVAALAGRRLRPRRAIAWSGLLLVPGFAILPVAEGLLGVGASALAAVLLVFCALAVQSVLFNGFFLGLAAKGEEATDVTFLTALVSVAALAGFVASGLVAGAFGYGATLLLAAAGCAATAVLAAAARGRAAS